MKCGAPLQLTTITRCVSRVCSERQDASCTWLSFLVAGAFLLCSFSHFSTLFRLVQTLHFLLSSQKANSLSLSRCHSTPSRDGLAFWPTSSIAQPRQLQRRRFLFSARGRRRRRRCAKGARAQRTAYHPGRRRRVGPRARARQRRWRAAPSCCFSEGPSKKWKDDVGRTERESRM